MSNDNSNLDNESEKDGTFREGEGLTKYNRVSVNTEDPADVHEMFQTKFNTPIKKENYDEDKNRDGGAGEGHTWVAPIGIRKLVRKHPDYRHGPVKIYTKEEIEEYERCRSQEQDTN